MLVSILVPDSVIGAYLVAAAILTIVTGTAQVAITERADHLKTYEHQPTQRLRYGLLMISAFFPALWLVVALPHFGFKMMYETAPDVAWQASVSIGWRLIAIAWLMVLMLLISAIATVYVSKRPTFVRRRKIVRDYCLRFVVYYVDIDGNYYLRR